MKTSGERWRVVWQSYMLIYEQDGDIFAVLSEALEGIFDGSVFGLLVDDEEVLLGVWRCGDVLNGQGLVGRGGNMDWRIAYTNTGEEKACYGVLGRR